MLRVCLYSRAGGRVSVGDAELLDTWRGDSDSVIWLDLAGQPQDTGQGALLESFGLHALAIQDALRSRHPPKIEAFDDHTFVLLKELAVDASGINFDTSQLALFLGERFLVTRHSDRSLAVEELFTELSGNSGLFGQGPDAVAVRLCRLVVNRYLKILLDLEPRLEALEVEIMEDPRDAILAELMRYKSELKKFRRVFLYHQQIFADLKSRSFPALRAERLHQVVDVYEQQERAGSLAGLYYELCSDLVDGYLSVASHRLNQIMKVLTVVMAIFVPLSFLAGIYGMNFENMPELHSSSGYFILLAIMGAIAVALLALFRKKRWL